MPEVKKVDKDPGYDEDNLFGKPLEVGKKKEETKVEQIDSKQIKEPE